MKLIHTAFAVAAASLLPSAAALEPQSSNPDAREWRVAMTADVTPAAHGAVAYPTRAASLAQNGRCDVSFDIGAEGDVSNVQVMACTSDDFTREAARVAGGLSYPAGAPHQKVRLQINWTIEGAANGVSTASLN